MLASNGAAAVYDSGCNSRNGIARADAPQIISRYATREDVIAFWDVPHPGTLRALVVEVDDELACIIGIVREGNVGKYFCDIKPALEPYLKSVTVMRVLKKSMDFVHNYQGPVVSVAEHAEGCRMLNRLGFTHLEGALYGWLK